MLQTYEAVLRGNRLEWGKEIPQKPENDDEMVVLVTILKYERRAPHLKEQGQRMAKALEKLATIHPVVTINDPQRWEREIRQDRPLLRRS
ncbi:MAG: hypothetical protein GY801_11355 [bacterium]|nr:hypothetical protein [bacterium]